jgi:hypothetical protein
MAVPFGQWSFAAGEIAPSLYGHVDLARFAVAAATARNVFVSYRGGLYSRAGTKFVGFSKQTGRTFAPRMITFQFSINQGLALEFGNQYMRVIQNGSFVTETAGAITGATNANPCVITQVAHGYTTGDWVFIAGVGGMTQLNGRTFVIAVLGANTYSLQDVYGNNIDSTGYGAYTAGGTGARIYTLVTPYGEADLRYIKWTQSADTMSMCCWNQQTGTIYQSQELVRAANNNWTISNLAIGTVVAAPTGLVGAASASGAVDYKYAVTAVDVDGNESVASNIADIPAAVDIASTAGNISLSWTAVGAANTYNVYKATPAYSTTVPAGVLFGYIGTTYGTAWVDSNDVADFSQVPPTASSRISKSAAPMPRARIIPTPITCRSPGHSKISTRGSRAIHQTRSPARRGRSRSMASSSWCRCPAGSLS